MKKTEEDILKEVTVKHFEFQGSECETEKTGFGDRRPDVIAWNRLTNNLYAIECKGSGLASLFQALGQALPYKAMAHEVYVSVPDKTFNDPNLDKNFLQKQCDQTSINILFFNLKNKSLTGTIESNSKNTEFKKDFIDNLKRKFRRSGLYDVFDEHPEYYREVVRIISSLGGSATTSGILKEFIKLKGRGTKNFLKKYPNMSRHGGFGITKKDYMDSLMSSSRTLGLVDDKNGKWILTPTGKTLLRNMNPTEGDILNYSELLIFKVIAFHPILSKDVYELVKQHPKITKKELTKELAKILPRYNIKHDPGWFVDRLTLFLSNCDILEKHRTRVGNLYQVKV